jgi:hypothetical protein
VVVGRHSLFGGVDKPLPVEDAPVEDAPVEDAPPPPKPARTIRSAGRAVRKVFKKPTRAVRKVFKKPTRAVRKVFKKPVRAVRKVFKKPTRAVRKVFKKPTRAVRKVFKKPTRAVRKVFKKPTRAIKGLFRRRRRCFAPETPIKLENGKIVPMKDLQLGDILINGSIVDAVMTIRNTEEAYYKLPGNILVTGSHYVKHGERYIQVMHLPGATHTEIIEDTVSCIVTNDHKIPVGDFTFWDWEDNLIPSNKNINLY